MNARYRTLFEEHTHWPNPGEVAVEGRSAIALEIIAVQLVTIAESLATLATIEQERQRVETAALRAEYERLLSARNTAEARFASYERKAESASYRPTDNDRVHAAAAHEAAIAAEDALAAFRTAHPEYNAEPTPSKSS